MALFSEYTVLLQHLQHLQHLCADVMTSQSEKKPYQSALTQGMVDFAREHFVRFPSIENHHDERFLNRLNKNEDKWYGFEKIHGSNVSFVSDGDSFGWCKRTAALTPQEKFPGIDSVCERYSDILKKAVRGICATDDARFPVGTVFYLYGELFGGCYDHPDIPPNKGARKIQKGISYTPDNEFLVFDMMYKNKNSCYNFVAVEEMLQLCQRFKIPHVPVYSKAMGVHSLEELLKLENHTATEIHQLFGLPEPVNGKWAEGLVLRPNKTFFLEEGGRAIIKFKSPFFSEVSKTTNAFVPDKVSEIVKNGTVAIQDYLTQNRYDALVSKCGRKNKVGKMVAPYMRDVKKDFVKDHPDQYTDQEIKAIVMIVTPLSVSKLKQWYSEYDIEEEATTSEATTS